ncbi:MAG: sialate O-acetylesterase [Fibrobacterota bacterium]
MVHIRAKVALLFLLPALSFGASEKPWKVFLLFGQSNMAGGAASDAEDRKTNPRVKMLAYTNCSSQGLTYNSWYTAAPNLHGCGTGMGLGDWFGRIVADSFKTDTIALIPCAVPGVDISFFSKNVVSSRRKDFSIPPDNHWTGAYPWMLERLKKAQEKGVISGILFHQGEADWSDTARKLWVNRVATVVKDLKADLGFADVPFLAGELRSQLSRSTNQSCCYTHNTYVATLAKTVPNGHLVSSQGLDAANDAYHLTAVGNREFGKRYAAAMIAALPKSSEVQVRPGAVNIGWSLSRGSRESVLRFETELERIEVFDLQGRLVAQGAGRELRFANGSAILRFRAKGVNGSSQGIFALGL